MKSWERIWTEIAEAYGTPRSKRTEEQRKLANCGLCRAFHHLGEPVGIIENINPYSSFWWPYTVRGDTYRAFFAGLMVAMGDEDFQSFLRWCKKHP